MSKSVQFRTSVAARTPKRPRTILFWLRWLVIIGIVPAWGATALTIATAYQRERAMVESDTTDDVHSLMLGVDRDLASATAALQGLATSPHLTSGEIAAFQAQAREVLLTQAGNAIVLMDPTGQQIMTTLTQYGEKLPRTSAPDLVRRVVETAKPAISDLFIAATSKRLQVAAGVPVIRNGRVIYVLTMGILPEHFADILRDAHLPADWVAAVFDSKGTILSRTHAPEQFVGLKGSPTLLRRIAETPEGVVPDTLGGVPVLATFNRSDLSGWAVTIGIPTAGLTAELHRSMWWSVAVATAVSLLALFLARHISLRIARSIGALSEPALALASDAPIAVPWVEIKEVDDVGRALARAGHLLEERTIARDQAEARARAHQAELAHISRVSLAGEMAAGMAHELSQPLTAIIAYGRGCLRLLTRPTPDLEMLKEAATEVVQQAERAADVLTHLRDFVRPGPSRQDFFAVKPLIDTAVGLATIEAMQTKVEIKIRADPALPLVFVDNIQIEQVLLNLLRNAIDAMVTAEVTQRRIVVNAQRKGAGRVEISVADTGPGISDGLREKILDPFVTTKPRGMGMGLSISRSIVEAHGGSLRSLRGDGSGAIFAFDLPMHDIEGNLHAR